MQYPQSSIIMTLGNVRRFFADNAESLGDVASEARARLAEAKTLLDVHANDQAASSLEASAGSRRRWQARRTLVADFIQPIVYIASCEAAATPELSVIRIPRPLPRDVTLASFAIAIGILADQHRDRFVEAGLPPDFLDRIRSASDALIREAEDRQQSLGNQQAATKGLEVASAEAVIRLQILHTFIRRELRNQPALYAGWLAAKRIQHRRVPRSRRRPGGTESA